MNKGPEEDLKSKKKVEGSGRIRSRLPCGGKEKTGDCVVASLSSRMSHCHSFRSHLIFTEENYKKITKVQRGEGAIISHAKEGMDIMACQMDAGGL